MTKTPLSLLWCILAAALLAGCADLRQAKLDAGNDPAKAIDEVTNIEIGAQHDQLDVLAAKEFAQGHAYLEAARRALKAGEAKEAVLKDAAIAKAYFQDANRIGMPRQANATRILEARASALAADVRTSDALVATLADIDDDLKSETKQFSRALSPDDFSELQKRYLALEVQGVQNRTLGQARKVIAQAKDDNANKRAPKTLRTAELDYETGMNMIAQSPRDPSLYSQSVHEALTSATQLNDVMNVIKGAPGTPEHIAIQIVQQKRALGELSSNVGKLKENLQTTQQSLQEKEGALKRTQGALKTQEQQLAMAATQVKFQQAMDEARRTLPADDALVYQQGNTLVFRLKRVNFQSGTAIIPETSKPLLAKVDAIIRKLNVDNVVVQGHTDSVGSEDINKKLSTERASAVADYLYTLGGNYKLMYAGYGDTVPIASNQTADGRATNRRVDLVVSVKQ
ncbi:MAG: OmpA family protein [Gammaproteobacteria bacterium]|nr:OmpA family protein [Gammaproteobacteria bacterium]